MRYLLLLLFCLPLIVNASENTVSWGKAMKSKKNESHIILAADENNYYILKTKGRKSYLKKVNSNNHIAIDSVKIKRRINKVIHNVYNAIYFGGKIWVLSFSNEKTSRKRIFWMHELDTESMIMKSPKEIFHYYIGEKNKINKYSKDDLFYLNYNLMSSSPLGQYLFILSSNESKPFFNNGYVSMDLNVQSKLYMDNLYTNYVSKFKLPTKNFKIYQSEIDLDGSVYLLGRTHEYSQKNSISRIDTYGKNNLQIIKFNPINGHYDVVLIEDDIFLHDFKMVVDNNIHIVGMGDTDASKTVLVYQVYNSDLIIQYESADTLEDDYINGFNSSNDKKRFKYAYKKQFGHLAANYPLLNFDFINIELLDNGNLILVMEKNTIEYSTLAHYETVPFKKGELLMFCFNNKGLTWKTSVHKNQRSTIPNDPKLGAFVHADGTNIHVYYNTEGQFSEDFTTTTSKDAFIKHVIIDEKGKLISVTNKKFGGLKRLFLDKEACYEPYPGKIVFKASNEKQVVFGSFQY